MRSTRNKDTDQVGVKKSGLLDDSGESVGSGGSDESDLFGEGVGFNHFRQGSGLVVLRSRVSREMAEAVDALCDVWGISRAELVRKGIIEILERHGIVPVPANEEDRGK